MLSDDLSALSARLGAYAHTGCELSPEGVAAIVNVLDALADEATAFERQAVPAAARLDPAALPAGVVALRPETAA